MMMWWGHNRKDGGGGSETGEESPSASSSNKKRTTSNPTKKSRLGGTNRKSLLASASVNSRRRPRLTNNNSNKHAAEKQQQQQQQQQPQQQHPPESPSASNNSSNGDEGGSMTMAETHMGIEVSLSHSPNRDDKKGTTIPRLNNKTTSSSSAMISFKDELLARQKVVRTQFNVTQWPILGPPPGAVRPRPAPLDPPGRGGRTAARHRVQLTQPVGGAVTPAAVAAAAAPKKEKSISFEDALFLLQNQEIVDEVTCVRQELTRLNCEIDALKEDRSKLEQRSLQIPASPPDRITGAANSNNINSSSSSSNVMTDWEIHHLLMGNRLTAVQRIQLQEHRGLTLTAHLHNPKAAEALAQKCGAKGNNMVSSIIQGGGRGGHGHHHHHHHSYLVDSTAIMELSPETCRDGGAATTIQHVSLMNTSAKEHSSETAFFVSRDNGKGYYWGLLPDRLFRRLRGNGMDPKRAALELVYLATGPLDYYFAEFRSGETWWGSAVDDRAFHSICSEWDVYRVVFGTALALEDADGHRHATASWIILGRDGRAAWKNLPARLDLKLQTRMADEAAVAEVALGSGDSYFVRFLDGTVDYCLPSTMAYVCQQLEKQGSTITSVSIHPELSHDFIIRSSSIPPG